MNEKMNQDNTKHTNIRLPIETYEALKQTAIDDHRTLSDQIRFIIDNFLKIKGKL